MPSKVKNDYQTYLDQTHEIGEIVQVFRSIVYVSGLPGARVEESIVFENGDMGKILSLQQDYCEVLLFTDNNLPIGTKASRTNQSFQILVGQEILGKVVNALGKALPISKKLSTTDKLAPRKIDVVPSGMENRDSVNKPLETGFAIVDLLIPLGVGQKELIIGDRKVGKTSLLEGIVYTQALKNTICIYAIIGKRDADVVKLVDFCTKQKIMDRCVIVSSTANDSAGMIFSTPYAAMSIAEHFRDQGREVLLILDDLTIHAQYYREISLQAKRFPGRNSYPGDIFYIHSKLLERAGSFKQGKITCLPVAESTVGDLSGYIQTNLMAITDGHIFFDIEAFNQGRRPAINPYLSVTRVGQQAQTSLLRDLSHQLSSFLVRYEDLKDLSHFGSEFEDRVRKELRLGERIFSFFNQTANFLIPVNVSILVLGSIWNGAWANEIDEKMAVDIKNIANSYYNDTAFKQRCDQIVSSSKDFKSLVLTLKSTPNFLVTV